MPYNATRPLPWRMKVIDQALRAGRWPTDKSLAHELEADPRTIRRDLQYMRDELQAPIKFSRARRGYYYSEDTYRLPFLALSEGELISLSRAEPKRGRLRQVPVRAGQRLRCPQIRPQSSDRRGISASPGPSMTLAHKRADSSGVGKLCP
jgi:hypothetical protein